MSSQLVYIPFLLIVSLMVAALGYVWWWNTRGGGKLERDRQDAESRRRAPRLQMNGWRYNGTPDGDIRYRVYGTSPGGLKWKLEYDSDHSSSSSSPRLRLLVDSLTCAEHEWELMDRWSFDLSRKGVAGALIGGIAAIGSALSRDMAKKRDFFLGAEPRPVGSFALRERFVVVAASSRYDALIDAETEGRILNWPEFKGSMSKPDNCLSAGLRPNGMEVKLYVDGPSVEVIEQVVRLGEALADGTARARGRT
ncbi:MAG: hypothetical protein SF172_14105 [Burkholderiales bacterium]|nr:hypothetical protein [Burkholderiales bacterium]